MDNSNQTGPKESDIAERAAARRKPVFDPTGRVEHINTDETKIADVRRHPFGLFIIYLQVIVGLGVSLGLIIFFLPSVVDVLGVSKGAANAVTSLFLLIVVLLGAVFLVLATRIYQAHQLIVTDVNITQIIQIGLFNRQVSELSMENVEDVTARQQGIFPTMFNYGELRIETAGEQNNFIFIYCPNPNAYAKAVLDARQAYYASHNPRPNNV